jgi:hypothetical protein
LPKKDMDKMEKIENIIEFSKDLKNKSNAEIIQTLDTLNEEFNFTKNVVINLTHNLDKIEELYTIILKEYNTRQNG